MSRARGTKAVAIWKSAVAAGLLFSAPIAHATPAAPQAAPRKADPIQLSLSWHAPAPCPARPWVVARVQEFLDRRVIETAEGASFQLQVAWNSPAFTLTINSADEQRSLSDGDCHVVADAAAFIVASALDPLASYSKARPLETARQAAPPKSPPTQEAPPPQQAPQQAAPQHQETAAPSAPPSSARQMPPPPKREVDLPRPEVALWGGLLEGIQPRLSFAAGGGVGVRTSFWALRFKFGAVFPQTAALNSSVATVETRPAARLSALLAKLDACYFEGGALEWPMCLRVQAASVRGSGDTLTHPNTTWLPWAAVGPQLGARWNANAHLHLEASVGIAYLALRPRFLLAEQTLYEVPIWTASTELSAGYTF